MEAHGGAWRRMKAQYTMYNDILGCYGFFEPRIIPFVSFRIHTTRFLQGCNKITYHSLSLQHDSVRLFQVFENIQDCICGTALQLPATSYQARTWVSQRLL